MYIWSFCSLTRHCFLNSGVCLKTSCITENIQKEIMYEKATRKLLENIIFLLKNTPLRNVSGRSSHTTWPNVGETIPPTKYCGGGRVPSVLPARYAHEYSNNAHSCFSLNAILVGLLRLFFLLFGRQHETPSGDRCMFSRFCHTHTCTLKSFF